jgi:uncharacterized integral membrane protein
MGKIKNLLMLLIGAILSIFIYENWVTAPYIKLFGREVIQLNISIIILLFFAFGFMLGMLSCFALTRSRRKTAEPASGEEKVSESQSPTQQEKK